MSYRIRPDRALDDEVQAAAAKQLGKAIAALTDRPDGLHEAVHTARKHIKRARALYRLVALRAPEFQQQENDRLREMARTLSGVRDATALIEAGRYLQETATSEDEAQALARIIDVLTARRDRLSAEETDLEEKAEKAVATCREALDALNATSFGSGRRATARIFQESWRKTGRKATKALSECHAEGHTDQFHELRKRSQDCWMHHALLRDIWPAAMRAKQLEAKELVDILGRYLDLSMLSEVTDREPHLFNGSDDRARLLEAIISRQQSARQEALTKARWVFADEPQREARTIKRLWLEAGE
ncbi:CHAD domain-containing protein [Rhizobium sp. BR 362]|uniref:CHAD domain-containing protein n=1 Tax=Rhizobium sp. BR 362 TaxID=3040670 RepID=UPI002F4139DA